MRSCGLEMIRLSHENRLSIGGPVDGIKDSSEKTDSTASSIAWLTKEQVASII